MLGRERRTTKPQAPGFPRRLVQRFIPAESVPDRPPESGTSFGAPLARLGPLEVRLARNLDEVRRAQALRYHVFYTEKSAIADVRARQTGRDADVYDDICDHLLVLDHDCPVGVFGRRKPKVVGTYRLLRQTAAAAHGGFYSAAEFDLQPLIERRTDLRFLELGRSCVLAPYRNKRSVELLWQGIWAYVQMHQVDVMIGCASLEGTDPDRLAVELSFLHHYCAAPAEWAVAARPELAVEMDRMPRAAVDVRSAMRLLPPLIRGYLRLGAMIGAGAVVDRQFGTTDVLIILPCTAIDDRYKSYYGGLNLRRAACRSLP